MHDPQFGSWLSTIIRAIPDGAPVSDASAAVFNTKKDPANSHTVPLDLTPAPQINGLPTQTALMIGGGLVLLTLLLKRRKPA